MTTPGNPAAPSARPRKPRAPRQNRPAQATSAAQTAQNPTPDQTPTPAGKDVPPGWYVFGHHADRPGVKVEFSEETDEDGAPLWERPIALPAVIDGVALDDGEEIASPDPAHPFQPVVRALLGPGFDAFLGETKED